MTHDDANDDAGLESLRAAWRSLPDEDPPDRGLAQLMAAARVKAEEMSAAAQPSLWERFTALMRRPQVLALATIMILIGGAVFISQRQDQLQATSEVATHDERFAPAPASTTAHGPASGSAQAVGGGAAPQAPAADPAALAPAEEQKPEVTEDRATERAKSDARATERATSDTKVAAPNGVVTSRPAAKKPARKAAPNKSALDLDDDFSSTGAKLEAEASAPTDEVVAGPGAGPTGTASPAPAQTAPAPTVKQLHEQMRAAAARKDCATVRTVAKQIARRDAPYYRANIATDQTLAACLH